MSAALTAPARTGKTALIRRLHSGLPEAHYYIHDVKGTGQSRRDMCREIAVACGAAHAAHAGSYPIPARRLRPRLRSRRRS